MKGENMEKIKIGTFIDERTGKSKDLFEGDRIVTDKQLKGLIGKDELREQFENGDLFQCENNFVWVCYTYNGLLNVSDYELERQDITRLIYFACFINYDGYLKDGWKIITKSRMRTMSRLSENTFYTFYNKMVNLGIFIELEDGKISIKEELFSKGTLKKSIKKDNDFTRLYTKTVKNLYESVKSKHHNVLGIYFSLIPYIHRQSNIVCYNPDSHMEEMKIMTAGDLSRLVNHRYGIGKFIDDMLSIELENGDKILSFAQSDKDKEKSIMTINPDVIYGGNYYLIPENREKIMAYFR